MRINMNMTRILSKSAVVIAVSVVLASCGGSQQSEQTNIAQVSSDFYGTQQPFVKEAVYFVMTDRFVDGDASNNHVDQGGKHPTWQLPLVGDSGQVAYVGYMGGDFQGIVNNAQYISDMGFTAVWLTPIVDNPDEVFTGGEPITFGGAFKDGGKTGYHGYWANNFYPVDEHYPSLGLSYKEFTHTLRSEYGLKTVLDIVANHGSPSFSMPVDQAKFGELYDIDNKLVADHQNLAPEQLDVNNPLHAFFHTYPDILQLSNLDESNQNLSDYLINSYLYWIEQGADAIRIDTIKHVPHEFWKRMSDAVRNKHPQFYMFGESFDYDANFIAQHTLPKNGGISVLDFPMQKAMTAVFENPHSDFAELGKSLYLTHGPYANPYELATFYDNHDMPRLNASDAGFIDANNWLFTVRGIPVVYQGSELGFMRGLAEHKGNRNYLGQANIELAKQHPIHAALSRIATVRKNLPALQNGLQLMLELKGDRAAFYRILVKDGVSQTALVLLNKGENATQFTISKYMQTGKWQSQLSDDVIAVTSDDLQLTADVPAHGVAVWLREGEVTGTALLAELQTLMSDK